MIDGKIHVGVGFATGRKSFREVLKSYIFHLRESQFILRNDIALSLFVAYDTRYSQTCREDYEDLGGQMKARFFSCRFIGAEERREAAEALAARGAVEAGGEEECFGSGYAAQRNIILYEAMRSRVDYLIFLDDDEYPLAVTNSGDCCLWSGQHVIESHVKYLRCADVTNGFHCGYLSPLPALEFDGIVPQEVFRTFVDALGSDVLSWDTVRQVMENGGVTYADKEVLRQKRVELVPEEGGARFITGGNLGINLTNPDKVLPFYNPPGARGEDSFLSTCLHRHTVKRIPAYTFHDGFSLYGTLLDGVLPTNLQRIAFSDSRAVADRFYKACIGWIRYKPLYTYITRREEYAAVMAGTEQGLRQTLPNICAYLNDGDFFQLLRELEQYADQVEEHYAQFQRLQETWERVKASLF